MLHGSMLRRKRSMLHTYALLLWLVAMETGRISARLALALFLAPLRAACWLASLQFVLSPARRLSARLQAWRSGARTSRRALVVFTRLPSPGRTKSRLMPYIGPENAALVMRVLTENLVRRLQPLRRRLGDSSSASVYLAYKDQCRVICEPGACNRPVQLWMECIHRHRAFVLPSFDSCNGECGGGSGGDGDGDWDGLQEQLEHDDGAEGDDSEPEFRVSDALEVGAFEARYLDKLTAPGAPPPYAARLDSISAPSRVAHLLGRHDKHQNSNGVGVGSGGGGGSSSGKRTATFSAPVVSSSAAAQDAAAATPLAQSGSSIGATLESALWSLFGRGYSQVVLLSSDVPALSDSHAEQALNCLDSSSSSGSSGCGLVLGKTTSGGVYLLAADRGAVRRHLGGLFRGILWGSGSAFDSLAENALKLGLRCATLRPVLRDLDTVEDLGLMESELGIPSCLFVGDAITVLIPARNEADHIETTLRNLLFNCSRSRHLQIVVVDGRSVDGTGRVARQFFQRRARSCLPRADLRRVRLEVRRLPDRLPTGRGHMIRWGAQFARGAYYLVLHADSSLPENWDDILVQGLARPGIVAGAFTFHLKIPNELCFTKDIPWALRTLLLELHTNWRCRRYEMPVGSQGLFMHAYYYAMSGGYKAWPFLEDIEFVERVKQLGHVAIADAAVMTSPRRWITHGFLAVCGLNALILLAYRMGVDAKKLGAIYYSVGKSWVRVAPS